MLRAAITSWDVVRKSPRCHLRALMLISWLLPPSFLTCEKNHLPGLPPWVMSDLLSADSIPNYTQLKPQTTFNTLSAFNGCLERRSNSLTCSPGPCYPSSSWASHPVYFVSPLKNPAANSSSCIVKGSLPSGNNSHCLFSSHIPKWKPNKKKIRES